MKELKSAQAAIEFLATYGWAFLIILIVIGALSYFGVLSPSKLLPDRCNFGSEIACVDYTIGNDGLLLKLRNSLGVQIIVDSLAVSTETRQLTCVSNIIGRKWKPGDVKTVQVSCVLGNGDIVQGDKQKLNLKMSYHAAKSTSAFGKEVNGEVYSSVKQVPATKIRLLSIYPCGCLIDKIAANYGTVVGYPKIEVTCLNRDAFTPDYDLSVYDAVAFDGADCWPGSISIGSEQNVERFVNTGGGAIFGHDFFYSNRHQILRSVAGFQSYDGCCQTTAFNKLLDDSITKVPYVLPNPLPTQCTHGTGEFQKQESREEYGGPGVYDHYLTSYLYGDGKSVFTEWGHCAYDCSCNMNQGMPGADESKSLINSVYYVAGFT